MKSINSKNETNRRKQKFTINLELHMARQS